jgi:hypothetical protein
MYNRYVQYYGGQRKNSQPDSHPETPPTEHGSSVFSQKDTVNIPPSAASKEPFQKPLKEHSLLQLPSLSDIKGMLQGFLGDKMDISDLLLILILLLIYLEKEDEEILITLSALVVMGFN